MRMILCLLLGLVAAFFAFVGLAMTLVLPLQAEKDRAYYQQFKVATVHLDDKDHLPETELGGWRATPDARALIRSSSAVPGDCDPSFKKAAPDRVVLSFWRGERTECYAYPSGRTTLPMSVSGYLFSGLGMSLLLCWLLAASAALGAIRLRPRKEASVLSSADAR